MDTGFYYLWRRKLKDKPVVTKDCSHLVMTMESIYNRLIALEERVYKLEHPEEFYEDAIICEFE